MRKECEEEIVPMATTIFPLLPKVAICSNHGTLRSSFRTGNIIHSDRTGRREDPALFKDSLPGASIRTSPSSSTCPAATSIDTIAPYNWYYCHILLSSRTFGMIVGVQTLFERCISSSP